MPATSAPILVLQSAEAGAADAAAIADLCGSAPPQQSGAHAWRLHGAQRRERVPAWCATRRLDYAWVPEGRRFADLKLLALDMDSTLITIECIDEIGAAVGKKLEISAITEQAMRGEIDYPESLRQRVALLAGLSEDVLEDVYDDKLRLSPGAESLVAACREQGIKLLLVSGGFTFFANRVKERLGIDFARSNLLDEADGKLTGRVAMQSWGDICDGAEKRRTLLEVASLLGISPAECIAVGDGANDLPMMGEAGLSVAFHAKPLVREQAMVAINEGGLDRLLDVLR